MKIFVHTLITMATLALGSVALADAKAHVITGRVVNVGSGWIDVQSGKKRLTIETQGIKDVLPKVGDTVTVYYKPPVEPHYRFDPGPEAIKIEIIAAGGSKK
jgi:hypothetical protein